MCHVAIFKAAQHINNRVHLANVGEELVAKPFAFAEFKKVQSAEDAYRTVLRNAGASVRRDAVDIRLIDDVKNGTGAIIVSQQEVGGLPELQGALVQPDTDGDGMPDSWEKAHGFKPDDATDGNGLAVNGYTNLENHLNGLVDE